MFPRKFLVGDALNGTKWICFASDEEKVAGFQTWWMLSEVQADVLVHSDGAIALPDQPIGILGGHLTAYNTQGADSKTRARNAAYNAQTEDSKTKKRRLTT